MHAHTHTHTRMHTHTCTHTHAHTHMHTCTHHHTHKLTFTDKEVGKVLSHSDSMRTVVDHIMWVPVESILLWVPLCPVDWVLERWTEHLFHKTRAKSSHPIQTHWTEHISDKIRAKHSHPIQTLNAICLIFNQLVGVQGITREGSTTDATGFQGGQLPTVASQLPITQAASANENVTNNVHTKKGWRLGGCHGSATW